MNSLNQQQYLADFAPTQSLDKYAKGADPRVISGIVALSEMQQQAAQRQRAAMANGAAQGQMPTVRDKIMQMFQQANQPRQQPQQQPNPMAQGIMAQAHPQMQTAPMPQEAPQEVPQEAQMYHGGVARLPVNNRMFGYANGGIIAFAGKERSDVPLPVGQETPLTPEERARLERELEMRLIGERARAEGTPAPEPAPAPQEERESEMMRAVKTPFRAIGEGIKSLYASSPNVTPSPIGAADQDLAAAISNTEKVAPTAAPSNRPQLQGPRTLTGDAAAEHARLEKAYQASQTSDVSQAIEQERMRLESQGKKMTPDDVRAITARFAKQAQNVGIAQGPIAPPRAQVQVPGGPTAPPSAPPTAPGAKPPTIDQLLEQQRNLLQAANAPVGPQLPEKSITEKATDYLKAQDDYVRKTGDSEAAKKLLSLYDKAEKRALADDDAQAAQRAADARNNLWSYLSNFKGSSVAAGARSADAALQPLLAEQKKTNAEYRKYSYERDMNREKARAEAIAAEDARKRGEFDKAIKHEQAERAYELEAKKADDLANYHKQSLINQNFQTQATLAASREGHQVQREGHGVQLEIARLNRQATLAAHPDYVAEYQKRIKEQGQQAADAWLDSVGKVLGVTKGYDFKEEGLNVQRDKAVTAALKDYAPYDRALQKIANLEGKERTGKLKPEQKTELEAARAAAKKYYDDKYQEIHKTRPPARTSASGDAGQVVTEADIQTTMKRSGKSRAEVIAAAQARGYTIQ